MYKNKMFFFTNSKGQLTRHTSSKKETMWKKITLATTNRRLTLQVKF